VGGFDVSLDDMFPQARNPIVSNEEWQGIATVAVDTMKSMERLHAKQLEVAERMAQALDDLMAHLEEGAYAGDKLPKGHPMHTARKVRAEWEALNK
jgi:hypothetical protein